MWLVLGTGWEGIGLAAPPAMESGKSRASDELTERYEQLHVAGEYAAAIPLAKRACAILEKESGPLSRRLTTCLDDLGTLLQKRGEFEEARDRHERALRIRRDRLGARHPTVAVTLDHLGALHLATGELQEAERLFARALAMMKKDSLDFAITLNHLAMLRILQGEFKKSRELASRALVLQERMLSAAHPDIAITLSILAKAQIFSGELKRARPLLERASKIQKSITVTHPNVATVLDSLAWQHIYDGNYEKAEPLLKESLAIRKRALIPKHPTIAHTLSWLSSVHFAQGEYEDARASADQAIRIYEKTLGQKNFYMASALIPSAMLSLIQGDSEESELQIERALIIIEQSLGSESVVAAWPLGLLAMLRMYHGEPEKALPYLDQALNVVLEKNPHDRHSIAAYLTLMGAINVKLGRYERARLLFKNSLDIRRRDPENQWTALTLNLLGMTDLVSGNGREAEPLLQESVATSRRTGSPEIFVTSLTNLAALYIGQRRFGEAKDILEEAQKVTESETMPIRTMAVFSEIRGQYYIALGRPESAVEFIRRSLDIQYEELKKTLLFAEERRRLSFATTMPLTFHSALTLHLWHAPNHRPAAELALTTAMSRKGLLLEIGTRINGSIHRSHSPEHRHLIDELARTRAHYAYIIGPGSSRYSADSLKSELTRIEQKQRRIWRTLSNLYETIEFELDQITIGDIADSLPEDGALVEFVRYYPTLFPANDRSSPRSFRYAAYIVSPDGLDDWVDLGPADVIEAEVRKFRKELAVSRDLSPAMHDLIMAPLFDRLQHVRRLFIVPDGALYMIPFAALYDGKRFLVERHPLYILNTGRDLLSPRDANPPGDGTVTIVAHPTGAENLQGAEREAKAIGALFPQSRLLFRSDATESRVRNSGRPSVMHMATHGFFEMAQGQCSVTNPCIRDLHELLLMLQSPLYAARTTNSMVHSGLLLAADDVDDGRLTAYEISGWDLHETELVVLSACDTGMGEILPVEGAFGLRRAFATAGIESQVMSLWKVPDDTTAELMDAYYRSMLDGNGRADAMREVQIGWINSSDHWRPADWASFVVVGEWRRLSFVSPPVNPLQGPKCRGICCLEKRSGRGAPAGSMFIGLLGLATIRRRKP